MTEHSPDIHERTQEVLSALHDEPGSVTRRQRDSARAHLSRCPRCREFESLLADDGARVGERRPDERASDEFVARVLAVIAAERAAETEDQAVAVEAAAEPATGAPAVAAQAPEPEPPEGPAGETLPPAPADAPRYVEPERLASGERRVHRRRGSTYAARWGWSLAAAAVVLALFVGARVIAGSGGLGANLGAPGGSEAAAPMAAAPRSSATTDRSGHAVQGAPGYSPNYTDSTSAAAGSASKAATGTALLHGGYGPPRVVPPPLGPAQPPGLVRPVDRMADQPVFLSFGTGDAWRFQGWLRNTPSTRLVKVGEVHARLGSGKRKARGVYEWPGDRTVRFVQWEADDYQYYTRAGIRPFPHGNAYFLATGAPIDDWGTWPAWPAAVMAPPRGASDFVRGFKVPGGTVVYVAPNVSAEDGLALGPGGWHGPGPVELPTWSWWRGELRH